MLGGRDLHVGPDYGGHEAPCSTKPIKPEVLSPGRHKRRCARFLARAHTGRPDHAREFF